MVKRKYKGFIMNAEFCAITYKKQDISTEALKKFYKGLDSSDEKFINTPIYITNKNVDGMDWITVSFLNAGKLETGC